MEMDERTKAFVAGMMEPAVPYVPFEVYAEQFKDAFQLTRRDGICEIKQHTKGETTVFGASKHRGWAQILKLVGDDPENEVVIITGAGDDFVAPIPENLVAVMAGGQKMSSKEIAANRYRLHVEGTELIHAIVDNLHVPTIGAMNGPASVMAAIPLLCDITICSDRATFTEQHFAEGLVPADGTFQAFRGLMGIKRTAYMCYQSQVIDAQKALELGLVNEVVEHEKLNARAWELAYGIMQKDRYTRRVTHSVFKRYYREWIDDLMVEFGYEGMANFLTDSNKSED